MSEYKSYTERILTPTPTILGLRLMPYTLGHSIILKSANSKFITGGLRDCENRELIAELVFALLVCSTSYDDFKQEVYQDRFSSYLTEYVNRLTAEIAGSKEFNLFEKINAFASYLRNGTSTPLYYVTEDSNEIKNNPIEFEEAIVSTLMSECNFTRDECLNLPLVETLSAFLLYAHKQGTVELISKDVWELKERMKAGTHKI